MIFKTPKRPRIDCLPAYVKMKLTSTIEGARITAAAVHSAQWRGGVTDIDKQPAIPLDVVADGSEFTVTLSEELACLPGVWRICLLEDCAVCECCDVELVNECVLESCTVVEIEPEDDKCHCP